MLAVVFGFLSSQGVYLALFLRAESLGVVLLVMRHSAVYEDIRPEVISWEAILFDGFAARSK